MISNRRMVTVSICCGFQFLIPFWNVFISAPLSHSSESISVAITIVCYCLYKAPTRVRVHLICVHSMKFVGNFVSVFVYSLSPLKQYESASYGCHFNESSSRLSSVSRNNLCSCVCLLSRVISLYMTEFRHNEDITIHRYLCFGFFCHLYTVCIPL